MEKWDIYNANRELIGKTKYRNEPLEDGEYHIVVGIWTVNSKGELLMTLRHPDKEYYANLWENTGGCILEGETSREGAARELFEETGIKVDADELVFLGTEVQPGLFMDAYVVKSDAPIESLTLQDGETVDAMWVSMKRFDEMVEEGLFVGAVAKRFEIIRKEVEQVIAESQR